MILPIHLIFYKKYSNEINYNYITVIILLDVGASRQRILDCCSGDAGADVAIELAAEMDGDY